MKVLKKLLYAIPIAGIIFASCTDVEKMEIEHIGGFNTMKRVKLIMPNSGRIRKQPETMAVLWLSDGFPTGHHPV